MRQHYSTAETCRMIRYSLDFFQRFAEHTGGASCGFRHTGYLLGVDARMRAPMEASVALQRSVGIDTRLVSPDRDARDRAAPARRRSGGRLLRAGVRLLQPRRDRPGLRAGRARGGRAHPGGHRGASGCSWTATASAASAPPRATSTPRWSSTRRACGAPGWAPWPASSCRSTCAVTRSASSPGPRPIGGRTRWCTTSSPTSTPAPRWASTSWWAGSTPRNRTTRPTPTPTGKA